MRVYPSVSVIIPTYRRGEVLVETLERVVKQRYPSFEVIVVDQTPRGTYSQEVFERLIKIVDKFDIKYIHLDTPNLPNARNRGIVEACGSIILFGDDDIVPGDEWIEAHVRNYEDDMVGGVVGRIQDEFISDPIGEWIGERLGKVGYITFWGRPIGNFDSSRRTAVQTVRGCNMSFRKEVFSVVGLFDNRFIGNAQFEETDMSFRIRSAGFKLVYEPMAFVKHLNSPKGGCRSASRAQWYMDYLHNKSIFFAKNMPLWTHPPFFLVHLLIAFREGLLRAGSRSVFRELVNSLFLGYILGKKGMR